MSWEWSHTTEAYSNCRQNLQKLSNIALLEIWAEWKASKQEGYNWQFNQGKYSKALRKARRLLYRKDMREALEGNIWEWMAAEATCTNGGWKAWACPYGCGCHLVSFSLEKEE